MNTRLMLGSARQLRLRPAAVAFALGETVELQDDEDSSGRSAVSMRLRKLAKLNATIGWRSSGALAM